MSYGPIQRFPATMVSGNTTTGQIDLRKAWSAVWLEICSMPSNTQIYIQAASVTSGTFRRVCHPVTNGTVPQTLYEFAIQSGTTSDFVPVPNGFQYMKVETTATVDNGTTFYFVCLD
jgi:hypothetical protein